MNLSTLSCGTLIGWCSPAIMFLASNESTLISGPMNVNQASWIASCHYVGEAIGIFIFCLISRCFGKKFVTIVAGVMYTVKLYYNTYFLFHLHFFFFIENV